MPQAGKYRHLLAFEARAEVDDGHGNVEGEFAEQFRVKARIRPRLGGEDVVAGRLQGVNLANILVRYSAQTAAVTTAWRARQLETGAIYNIRSIVDPDEGKKRELEMLGELGRDNG